MRYYLVVFAALTPIWILALSLALLFVYGLVRGLPGVSGTTPPNTHPLWLVLSPNSYLSLVWRKYFWGLFYYALYFFITLQLLQSVGILVFGTAGLLIYWLGAHPVLVVAALVLTALVGQQLIVAPYYELLTAAARIPLARRHRADSYEVRRLVSVVLKHLPSADTKSFVWSRVVSTVIRPLEKKLDRLQVGAKLQDFDARSEALAVRQRVRRERWAVYGSAIERLHLESAIAASGLDETGKRVLDRVVSQMRTIEYTHL